MKRPMINYWDRMTVRKYPGSFQEDEYNRTIAIYKFTREIQRTIINPIERNVIEPLLRWLCS